MCGRYYVDDSTEEQIRKVVKEVDPRMKWGKRGDIHPTDAAAVISAKAGNLYASDMKWGFVSSGGGLLINARSESAAQKVSFSESLLNRRCVMPAAGFYEWNRAKEKVSFTWNSHPVFYLAGFYKRFGGEERFIILTMPANESVSSVHDRMPVLLPEEEITPWIFDSTVTGRYLTRTGPVLTRRQEYEQMSLFG